jgi:uncharacterized protein
MISTDEKLRRLKEGLLHLESVLVAYSGGVDSTFLLRLCRDVLQEKVLAVTASSSIYPSQELVKATEIARSLSVKHRVIEIKELENPIFAANPPNRCYYCKLELFGDLKKLAIEKGMRNVVDGSNYDDLNDYRPGAKAAAELGIRHPLQEAQLTKEEIRALSRTMGLPTWNKPSLACLASRFPYGTPITAQDIAVVDEAETFLRGLGIEQVRVRHYGTTARIEVMSHDMGILFNDLNRQGILSRFRELGYVYITVDLAGYRSGSMNADLSS